MTNEPYSKDHVLSWLRGDVPFLTCSDEQDTDLILSGIYSSTELCGLFLAPNAIPERRDEIAGALCVQLEDLLSPSLTPVANDKTPRQEQAIASFIRDHLSDFVDGDRRTGFGLGFEEIILPYVTSTPDSF